MDKKFKLVIKGKKEFSYIEYHADSLMKLKDDTFSTYYSLVQSILISNTTEDNYRDLTIDFEFNNDIFSMSKLLLNNIGSGELVSLRVPFLKVDVDLLKNLLESENCILTVLVKNKEKEILYSQEYKFRVLPINQISSEIKEDPRLFAKLVGIKKQNAEDVLKTSLQYLSNKSFQTYKIKTGKIKEKMLKEAEAIFKSLRDYDISFESNGGYFKEYNKQKKVIGQYQKIRMPDEVLRDRKATQMDLTLLFCACLEEIGYHSVLMMVENEFFAGFFTDDEQTFTNGVESKIGVVYNFASDPLSKIVFIDCSGIGKDSRISFEESISIPYVKMSSYLGDSSFAALDINSLKAGVFAAITKEADSFVLSREIEETEKQNEKLNSVLKTKYVDIVDETERDRFMFWEKKLLDLSERNPLVCFDLKLSNCVRVISNHRVDEDIEFRSSIKLLSSYDQLDKGANLLLEKDFAKYNIKTTDITGVKLKNNELFVLGLDKTLRTLIKKSNSAMEETGAPTLYLCLGLLNYKKTRKKERGTAPFMVLPIKISKDKVGQYFTINYDYDDLMINQTFFEYYKLDNPDFDFEKLYHLGPEFKYIDFVKLFKENNTEDIQLDEKVAFIANLTFSHYIMWRDLRDHKAQLKKNKIVQSILENKNVLDDVIDNKKNIEDEEKYANFAAPISYDSTQLKAIMECAKGKSFILDGPPGTGKSQTIVNMIVNAFYHGKTVLFVAEKKAALDVVADRLNKIMLGRFCLELHSNKANKTDFFARLGESMDLGAVRTPRTFEAKCQEIVAKRNSIASILDKMHTHKYLYSLNESIDKHENLKNYKFFIKLSADYLKSLDEEKEKRIYELIDTYIASTNNIVDYAHNPLKIVKLKELNVTDKDEVVEEFVKLKAKLNDILSISNDLMSILPISFAYTNSNIMQILSILDICFNRNLYISTLSNFISEDTTDNNIELFNQAQKLYDLRVKYKNKFNFGKITSFAEFALLDEYEKAEGFSNKFKARRKCKKALKRVSIRGAKYDYKNMRMYFEDIEKYKALTEEMIKLSGELNNILGDAFINEIDNLHQIMESYYATRSFISNVKALSNGSNFMKILTMFIDIYEQKSKSLKTVFSVFEGKFKQYNQESKKLEEKYCFDYSIYKGLDDEIGKQLEFVTYISNPDNFSQLVDIVNLNRQRDDMEEIGLDQFLNAIARNEFNYRYFKEIFEYSCALGYLKLYFKDSDINYFNPSSFELEIRKYKDLINEYNNLVIEMVSAKLSASLNHNDKDYAVTSPIGRLKKSISNGGRGVTIRETLIDYDGLIKKYFPCFLMSPMSAAQYLSVDTANKNHVSKFDIVIFDEASQIPTYEAIGAIARGKSLIVAGDPEQMPPSAYFTAGLEVEDEDIQYDDATSLLDECLSIDMPRIKLSYHYRSRHESLIQFSNENFYNKQLYTFPSKDISTNRVEFKYVDIKERKKNSAISEEEIDEILQTFKSIYQNKRTKDKSVGIIVFNVTQKEAVYEAIMNMLSRDKKLHEDIIAAELKTQEPWFVKSLESVQGDERDIIILSIGFTKNAAGMAIVNGPIVRENGQRRLNVAVSRSKEKMIVISTLRSIDFMSDNFIKNKGQLTLKHFIQYAEDSSYENNYAGEETNKIIVKHIKNDLEKKGYVVHANVGKSNFKVDLAILNDKQTSYALGIILDKNFKEQNITNRDKLYVQDNVLNTLDWKVINIYTLEYYKDKKRTIEKIIKALSKPFEKEEVIINPRIKKGAKIKFEYNKIKYQDYNTYDRIMYNSEKGFSSEIISYLNNLFNVEGPISYDKVVEKIKERSNIKQMSQKAKQAINDTLKNFILRTTNDQNQYFYWPENSLKEMNYFRIGGDRNLFDIAKEEILEVMREVLAMQDSDGSFDKAVLFKETLKQLKTNNNQQLLKTNERLDYVYYWAQSQNKLKPSNNLIIEKKEE